MRVPQVSERIKEAPAQVLRGVFAGIGQLLLITDKLRNKPPFGQQVPEARTPEASEMGTSRPAPETAAGAAADGATAAGATAAGEPAGGAPAEQEAAEPGADEAPKTPRAPRATRTPRATRAPQTPKSPAAPKKSKPPARDFDKTGNVRLLGPGGDAAASADQPAPAPGETDLAARTVEPADSGPPLPNYDELSIASLRARLRNLDVTKLRELVAYEQAHAARADVITMFEHRIAKLEAEAKTQTAERAVAQEKAEIEAREDVETEIRVETLPEAEAED
jgi:hypothetical protein